MDLRDYATILKARWRMIVALTLAGLAVAAAGTFATAATYRSSAQLFVTTGSGGDNVTNAYTGSLFSQQRVKSYARIITSQLVTGPVISQLQLPLTDAALAGEISATAELDTVLIDVSVTDRDPVRVQRLADAVSQQFASVVSSLETTDLAVSKVSPVKMTVVQRASGAAQVSPRTGLNLALGLLVGLSLGVGLAVLREQLDTRVKGVRGLQEEFGLATLVVIGFDADTPKHPLTVQNKSSAPRAEAFRQLRTNLQFVDVDHPPQSLVVSSSLPGEGKSTTACNLAIAMAEGGRRVLLVEADLRRPKLGDYLGVEGVVGLSDLLIGRVSLEDAVQDWGVTGNLSVLPSGPTPPNPAELLGSQLMADLIAKWVASGWFVILDAPPLLPVTDAAVLSRVCDGVLLVVRAGHTREDEVRQSLANLEAVNAHVLGAVINQAPVKGAEARQYGYGHGYGYESTQSSKQSPTLLAPVRAPEPAPLQTAPLTPATPAAETASTAPQDMLSTGPAADTRSTST